MKVAYLFLVVVSLASVLLLGSCAERPRDGRGREDGLQVSDHPRVYRVADEGAGVVCWVYSHGSVIEGGISCLPENETQLD